MPSRVVVGFIVTLALCASAMAAEPAKLTDPQIAHIAYTAGQLDIDAAQQALSKSKNHEVRAFADGMVRDHTAVNKQAMSLVKKLAVIPQNNDTSRSLAKQAASKHAELAGLKDSAFDVAYIANEVAFHRTVNDALRTTLIPSANNSELKALLQTGLKVFEGHQEHAEKIAAELKK